MRLFIALFCLSLSAIRGDNTKLAHLHHRKAGRGASLDSSTWPSDHGDIARSKYTMGGGLPKDFKPEDLKSVNQDALPSAQWIYTAGENSTTIYVMGGKVCLDIYSILFLCFPD